MEAEREPPKCQKRGSLATTTALTLFFLSVLYNVVKAVRTSVGGGFGSALAFKGRRDGRREEK